MSSPLESSSAPYFEAAPPLERLAREGAKPVHLERVLQVWVRGGDLERDSQRERRRMSLSAERCLGEVRQDLSRILRLVESNPSSDGSRRDLLELADGQRIESVLLPGDGLCISTQVGCAVGCGFCATGTLGLTRNLEVPELLAQVARARTERRVRKVVFMGMGEPAHNLRNVLQAIDVLGIHGEFGHKELVFSTVGEPAVFERLAAGRVKPSLALSLHSTDRTTRERLLPHAPRIAPRALVEVALAYSESTGQPLRLQWTLLAGVNDTQAELEHLLAWLPGRRVVVDFIEYNPVEAFAHRRTPWERTRELTHALHAAGIQAKLRSSAGQDTHGGCGQLSAARARARRL